MSDLNTAGLNGKGRVIADVANHALLVLAARLMAAFGVPAAMWLFAEIWTGLEEIEAVVRLNHTEIAVHEIRLMEGERRIAVLEEAER
jgi:hypothetical protein